MLVHSEYGFVTKVADELARAVGLTAHSIVDESLPCEIHTLQLLCCISMCGNEELPDAWLSWLQRIGEAPLHHRLGVVCFAFGTYEVSLDEEVTLCRQVRYYLQHIDARIAFFPLKISRPRLPSTAILTAFAKQNLKPIAATPVPPILADLRVRARRQAALLSSDACDLMCPDGEPSSIISRLDDRETIAVRLLECRSFKRLRICRANIEGTYLHRLSENPDLKHLDISSNRIGDGRFVRKLPSLQKLDLSGNKMQQLVLSELPPTLIGLNISKTAIERLIADKSLTLLKRLFCLINFIDNFDFLEEMPSLTELWLGYNRLDRFPRHIRNLRNLETLVFAGIALEYLPGFVLELPALKHLDLTDTTIDSQRDRTVLGLIEKGVKIVS